MVLNTENYISSINMVILKVNLNVKMDFLMNKIMDSFKTVKLIIFTNIKEELCKENNFNTMKTEIYKFHTF